MQVEDLEQTLGRSFEARALRYADRPAICTDRARITYAQLNSLANRQAHALLASGHLWDRPVALLLEQGTPFIAAMLAVAKAGGFFVPLDPGNPALRNAHMLQDTAAPHLITNHRNLTLARQIAPPGCRIVNLEDLSPDLPDHNPEVAAAPDALACVLYTSGSTGTPKGVMHDHRSLLHNARRHQEAFRITPDDRQTLLYTCGVYGGIRDTFNALLSGASLHPFAVKERGVEGLAQWLLASRITLFCSVATVFRQFATTLTGREQFLDLRLIKLGGEASHRKDVELYRAHFSSNCVLHCGLGATETGVVRHLFVDHTTQLPGDSVPLGYSVDGVEALIVDEHGEPVAACVVGEIVIRSRYIARGYWNQREANDDRFTSDPHDPQLRIYRTGDLGVLQNDGCLEHRGRKDSLVKIRGNRVELAEIESALRHIENVAHAAVVARQDGRQDFSLVAYIVASPGATPKVRELRGALAHKLPDYMIPTGFVLLDELPQTPNGKIDRHALPAPDPTRPTLDQPYKAPRTALESNLAAMWVDILGVRGVGTDDSFFDLGGNSLHALQLMSRIRAEHGRILPLALLFEADTIRKLADVIARGHVKSGWSPLVPIRPQGRRMPLFAVHPGGGNVLGYQEFVSHLHADQPVYGLQAHGVVDGQSPHTNIEVMAREYVRVIREIQAHGPYHLGGESFGGLVAYEMACQLTQAGEQVALLFVGDTWPKAMRWAERWHFRLACLTYPLTLSWTQWRSILGRKLSRRKVPPPAVKRYTYADELHSRNSLAHRLASRSYRPAQYAGDIILFRASEVDHAVRRLQHYFGEPGMSWRGLVSGRIEIHWMPGAHREMMHGPNAHGFARKLQQCIDRANVRAAIATTTKPGSEGADPGITHDASTPPRHLSPAQSSL
jgi:amino acid adenylation domain-containing protein